MTRVLTGAAPRRGDENWKYGQGSAQALAPLPDGVCYADSTELTALKADGEVLWTRQFERHVSSPVSTPQGEVFVHDGQQLYALEPDGSTRWSRPVQSKLDPAVGREGEVYVVSDRGRLQAIAPDGSEIFSRRLKRCWQKASFSPPRVGPQGEVLVADRDRHVRAFSSNGNALWSYPLPSGLAHGPVWSPDGGAALTTLDNEVIRLDSQGREVVRLKLEDELTSEPGFDAQGRMLVGDYMGTLWQIEDQARPLTRLGSAPVDLTLAPDGDLTVVTRWGQVHDLADPWSQDPGGFGGQAVCAPDGIVYVNNMRSGLHAIRTHRDPAAARAEEKQRAADLFAAKPEPEDRTGILEQGGWLLVGGVRVPRRQG